LQGKKTSCSKKRFSEGEKDMGTFRIDPNNHNSHADIVRMKLKCENAQFAIDWIPDADEDVLIYIGANLQLLF
jgi:hypothetical protein